MFKLFLVLVSFFAFGCTTPTKTTQLKEKTDSVYVLKSVEKTDSIYFVPATESSIEFELIVDSTGKIKPFLTSLKSGNKKLKVSVSANNKLSIQESSPEVLNTFQKQDSKDSSSKVSNTKNEKSTKQKSGSFRVNWFLLGVSVALIITGFILYKYKK